MIPIKAQATHMRRHSEGCVCVAASRRVRTTCSGRQMSCSAFLSCQRLNVASRHILSRSASKKKKKTLAEPIFCLLRKLQVDCVDIAWPPDDCANLFFFFSHITGGRMRLTLLAHLPGADFSGAICEGAVYLWWQEFFFCRALL